MFDPVKAQARNWPRPKTFAFLAIVIMTAYVLYRNERFLIDPTHPAWQHYQPFKWWLLPHGLAGACVMLLAPLQFADHLRRRFGTLHRHLRDQRVRPRATRCVYPISRRKPGCGAVVHDRDDDPGNPADDDDRDRARLCAKVHDYAAQAMDDPQLHRSTDLLGDSLHHRGHRPRPAVRLGQRGNRGVGVYRNIAPSRRAGEPGL